MELNEDLNPVKVSTKTIWSDTLLNYPANAGQLKKDGLNAKLPLEEIQK
jgi:hypothetical protein